jgi:hypothetical protein
MERKLGAEREKQSIEGELKRMVGCRITMGQFQSSEAKMILRSQLGNPSFKIAARLVSRNSGF